MPDPGHGPTEKYRDPRDQQFQTTRAQRAISVEWKDNAGSHRASLHAATTVGSAPSCGIVVLDPSVSRFHLELAPSEAGVTIRDLASTNGTFVDTNQIVQIIARGDVRLRLGRVELTIRHEREPVNAPIWPRASYGSLLGKSAVMRGLFEQLARVAPSDTTVLIQGETGTGKELVAQAIHQHSPRKGGPYVIVDCSALTGSLLESQLFGHVRGSFTGAVGAQEGAFEAADGGTLFLDEIGELPLELQPKPA